jgi:hypothetical protein
MNRTKIDIYLENIMLTVMFSPIWITAGLIIYGALYMLYTFIFG